MKIIAYCDVYDVLGTSCPIAPNNGQQVKLSINYLTINATVVQEGRDLELESFEILCNGTYIKDAKGCWHLYQTSSDYLDFQVKHSLIALIRQAAIDKARNRSEAHWEYEFRA